MITTLGATVSNTFANALFNWCTTSLPGCAAAAGTVELGATSGCAANDVLSATHRVKMDRRMGWDLDSTEHATFNWPRPIPAYAKASAPSNRNYAFLDEPGIISGPAPNMRVFNRRVVFAAGVALLILFWAIAVGPEPTARISISPEELVRAVTIQRGSLIDLYLAERVDPNGRDAQGRTPLLIAMTQQDWKTAQRLVDAGALPDLADQNGFTPVM